MIDENTKEKILECVAEIFRFIETSNRPLLIPDERDGWIASHSGDLVRGRRSEYFLSYLFEEFKRANSSIFGDTILAIQRDSILSPYIGGLVGTVSSASTLNADRVIWHCFGATLRQKAVAQFDKELVLAKLEEIGRLFVQKVAFSRMLIPIPGLRITLPTSRLELAEGVVLRRFTDEEFVACADSGVLPPRFPSLPFISSEHAMGCVVHVPIPVILARAGEDPRSLKPEQSKSRRFGSVSWSNAHDVADDILLVMRLVGAGRAIASGTLLFNQGFFGTSYTWSLRSTSPWSESDFEVNEKTALQMSRLWEKLASDTTANSLPPISIRRFNAAMERGNIDDSIADAVIAAEALFLSDETKDRGELGYRLRLRAAKLLAQNGHHYSKVMSIFSKAYSLRSTIVHGGKNHDTVSVGGERMKVDAFFTVFADLLRESMVIVVEKYSSDPQFATASFWDSLLFEGGKQIS